MDSWTYVVSFNRTRPIASPCQFGRIDNHFHSRCGLANMYDLYSVCFKVTRLVASPLQFWWNKNSSDLPPKQNCLAEPRVKQYVNEIIFVIYYNEQCEAAIMHVFNPKRDVDIWSEVESFCLVAGEQRMFNSFNALIFNTKPYSIRWIWNRNTYGLGLPSPQSR